MLKKIERKLAPFWRPLDADPDNLTDVQLVYAARGLPIPEPDALLPPDILAAIQSDSPNQSTSNLNLTVPASGPPAQVHGGGSDAASSNPGSAVGSPTSATHSKKSRGKAIAEALSLRSSRNNSSTDLSQREIALPNEPLVDGQPLEVVLYRSTEDCPICFTTYPPYLNYTRCCGNTICSECFVQIKRPDPHVPENHGEEGGSEAPNTTPGAAPANAEHAPREIHNLLVSEPAVCPYCTQPEFGVIYQPPPFRRGLVYTSPTLLESSAMSSQTSLHSSPAPVSPTSPGSGGRKRGQSLSANAPGVVTTDRIRPDWALKLAAQRTTQARRAAAATALHQAAFIMYNPERQFSLGSRAPRFMRRNTSSSNNGGREDPPPRPDAGQTGNTENDRLQQFEEVMMAEAIRLSLAAEEERWRKAEREAEKQAKKEAKKREKEERKAAKAQKKAGSVYGDGQASTSRSSVSLGLGRRHGNSGGNPQAGTTPEVPSEEGGGSGRSGGASFASEPGQQSNKGKAVDRGASEADKTAGPSSSVAIPQRSHHGPSHLRQTSNISSLSSSLADSSTGSYGTQGFTGKGGESTQGGGPPMVGSDAHAGPESLFNFTGMASTLGIDLSRENTQESTGTDNRAGRDETRADGGAPQDSQGTTQAPEESVEESVVTLQPSRTGDASKATEDKAGVAPEVRVVPGSPLAVSDGEFSKNIEHESSAVQRGGEVA